MRDKIIITALFLVFLVVNLYHFYNPIDIGTLAFGTASAGGSLNILSIAFGGFLKVGFVFSLMGLAIVWIGELDDKRD